MSGVTETDKTRTLFKASLGIVDTRADRYIYQETTTVRPAIYPDRVFTHRIPDISAGTAFTQDMSWSPAKGIRRYNRADPWIAKYENIPLVQLGSDATDRMYRGPTDCSGIGGFLPPSFGTNILTNVILDRPFDNMTTYYTIAITNNGAMLTPDQYILNRDAGTLKLYLTGGATPGEIKASYYRYEGSNLSAGPTLEQYSNQSAYSTISTGSYGGGVRGTFGKFVTNSSGNVYIQSGRANRPDVSGGGFIEAPIHFTKCNDAEPTMTVNPFTQTVTIQKDISYQNVVVPPANNLPAQLTIKSTLTSALKIGNYRNPYHTGSVIQSLDSWSGNDINSGAMLLLNPLGGYVGIGAARYPQKHLDISGEVIMGWRRAFPERDTTPLPAQLTIVGGPQSRLLLGAFEGSSVTTSGGDIAQVIQSYNAHPTTPSQSTLLLNPRPLGSGGAGGVGICKSTVEDGAALDVNGTIRATRIQITDPAPTGTSLDAAPGIFWRPADNEGDTGISVNANNRLILTTGGKVNQESFIDSGSCQTNLKDSTGVDALRILRNDDYNYWQTDKSFIVSPLSRGSNNSALWIDTANRRVKVGTSNRTDDTNLNNPQTTLDVAGNIDYYSTLGTQINPLPAQLTIRGTTTSNRLQIGSYYSIGRAAAAIQSSDYYKDSGGIYRDFGVDLVLNPLGGFVGIATKEPSATLDVSGTEIIRKALPYADRNKSSSLPSQLTLAGGASGRLKLGSFETGGGLAGVVQACVNYTGSSEAGNYLLINPLGGNVGINTATPSAQLDVTGDAKFSGAVTAKELAISSYSSHYAKFKGYYTSGGNQFTTKLSFGNVLQLETVGTESSDISVTTVTTDKPEKWAIKIKKSGVYMILVNYNNENNDGIRNNLYVHRTDGISTKPVIINMSQGINVEHSAICSELFTVTNPDTNTAGDNKYIFVRFDAYDSGSVRINEIYITVVRLF